MILFSESELEELKARLLPFGNEWTSGTGRALATARDGIDFLSAMKHREDFWAQLEKVAAFPIELAALRLALPTGTLVSDLAAEAYLRSLGLSEDELQAVVTGLDEPDFFDIAIRSAFAEDRPQNIARALERILETNSDILATQFYVNRLSESRGVVRAVSAMMGIALLLVGSACAPQAGATASPPNASMQTPAVPAPVPTPEPVPINVETPPVPASAPTPTPAPPVDPTPVPAARPHKPPAPRARYKGVSPSKRGKTSPKPLESA